MGHEDLNSNWVGAGHLKTGDKIKQADGTTGVVANVTTVQQTQEMFNLTVDEAHTFYVGTQGWLVHNAGSLFNPCTGAFEKLAADHPLTELAANANQVLKTSFPFGQYPNTTIAVSKAANGDLIYAITAKGDLAVAKQMADDMRAAGLKVFTPNGKHAEIQLAEAGFKQIGVSQPPCPACQKAFSTTFKDVSVAGWK